MGLYFAAAKSSRQTVSCIILVTAATDLGWKLAPGGKVNDDVNVASTGRRYNFVTIHHRFTKTIISDRVGKET
jgi:hypothetical protein